MSTARWKLRAILVELSSVMPGGPDQAVAPVPRENLSHRGVRVKAQVSTLLVLLASTNAMAADSGCKGNPALIGRCFAMRGNILMTGDIGPALDSDDGKHRIIIRAAPNSTKDVPGNVEMLMEKALDKRISAEAHGTYEVCPIPEEASQFPPGTQRYGCVNSASHLKMGDWSSKRKNSK